MRYESRKTKKLKREADTLYWLSIVLWLLAIGCLFGTLAR